MHTLPPDRLTHPPTHPPYVIRKPTMLQPDSILLATHIALSPALLLPSIPPLLRPYLHPRRYRTLSPSATLLPQLPRGHVGLLPDSSRTPTSPLTLDAWHQARWPEKRIWARKTSGVSAAIGNTKDGKGKEERWCGDWRSVYLGWKGEWMLVVREGGGMRRMNIEDVNGSV